MKNLYYTEHCSDRGSFMNKTLTSREAILSQCRKIVINSGINALNIRGVAKSCGVSIGSVYYYFPSKDELVIATVESVWKEIMNESSWISNRKDFLENVSSLFCSILKGLAKYKEFFSIHSIGIAKVNKDKGRDVMGNYFIYIKKELLNCLNEDKKVKEEVFSSKLSKSDFVDFVFSNLVTLLMKENKSCEVLLEIIKLTIY